LERVPRRLTCSPSRCTEQTPTVFRRSMCMVQPRVLVALAAALVVGGAPALQAHFKLLEPASWLAESERGDPQKLGPCGADPKDKEKTPLSNTAGKAAGGSKLHPKVQ